MIGCERLRTIVSYHVAAAHGRIWPDLAGPIIAHRVRLLEWSGKHLLNTSFPYFDPGRAKTLSGGQRARTCSRISGGLMLSRRRDRYERSDNVETLENSKYTPAMRMVVPSKRSILPT